MSAQHIIYSIVEVCGEREEPRERLANLEPPKYHRCQVHRERLRSTTRHSAESSTRQALTYSTQSVSVPWVLSKPPLNHLKSPWALSGNVHVVFDRILGLKTQFLRIRLEFGGQAKIKTTAVVVYNLDSGLTMSVSQFSTRTKKLQQLFKHHHVKSYGRSWNPDNESR